MKSNLSARKPSLTGTQPCFCVGLLCGCFPAARAEVSSCIVVWPLHGFDGKVHKAKNISPCAFVPTPVLEASRSGQSCPLVIPQALSHEVGNDLQLGGAPRAL